MTKKRSCVVAGALGITGRALVEHLLQRSDWEITALSRRAASALSRANFISVDLLNSEDCEAKLCRLSGITHIFFSAYAARATPAEEVAPNLAMLTNLVTAVESVATGLQHVQIVHGSKWYGNHLGPYRTPAKEDDPRHMPPNFYYDQQDWLVSHQAGKSWSWSAVRPHAICGFAVGSPMNHLLGLALYASICRELGLPLRFPGSPGAFKAVYQFTDARLLARSMAWVATTPACANQAYNMTNGECERWANIWPAIAACFDLPAGSVQTISLARFMADKEALWTKIQEKYGLKRFKLAELVDWNFIDWSYSNGFDQISNLGKARRAGWNESLDTETMFRDLFAQLAAEKIIPQYLAS